MATTNRKILGYIFIIIAIILALAIVGQFSKLAGAIMGIIKVFTGQLDSYQAGHVFGTLIYWLLHIGLTIFLWNTGIRWTKKPN